MQLSGQRAQHGARIEWSTALPAGRLELVVGGGHGSTLACAATPATVWIGLHGSLQVSVPDASLVLAGGQLLVTEDGVPTEARARGTALWIAVRAARSGWRDLLDRTERMRGMPGPVLLPGRHVATRALRQLALELARAALRPLPDALGQPAIIGEFAETLADLQADPMRLVDRCPGRTLAQRRAVFVRLQRVRRYMLANSHLDLDTTALALKAHYSLSHFIRSYHRVYGQTPHAALVEDRLDRARELLGNSALAVGEVALASGFENRCAFSRVFKRHFGVTAQEARRTVAA